MFHIAALVLTVLEGHAWKPEPCSELPDGVPCRALYHHQEGSEFVTPCPVESWASADGCKAFLEGKRGADQCPQVECPIALGKAMKLVCSGNCCPTCWAPDHVVPLERHAADGADYIVKPHERAPKHCNGIKCFTLICAAGQDEGYKEGDCCPSCVAR